MKKKLLVGIAIFIGICGFTEFTMKDHFDQLFGESVKEANLAQSGTKYGIIESTPEKFVVATPIMNFDVEKEKDGSYTLFGVNVKVNKHKNNNYTLDTTFGTFEINANNLTATKK